MCLCLCLSPYQRITFFCLFLCACVASEDRALQACQCKRISHICLKIGRETTRRNDLFFPLQVDQRCLMNSVLIIINNRLLCEHCQDVFRCEQMKSRFLSADQIEKEPIKIHGFTIDYVTFIRLCVRQFASQCYITLLISLFGYGSYRQQWIVNDSPYLEGIYYAYVKSRSLPVRKHRHRQRVKVY